MYSHPALATRESGDIHESRDRSVFFLQQKRRDIKDIPAVVENALLSTALGDLLLLLLIDLCRAEIFVSIRVLSSGTLSSPRSSPDRVPILSCSSSSITPSGNFLAISIESRVSRTRSLRLDLAGTGERSVN